MKKNELNGSVDLLAKAMRDVFTESMQGVREGVQEDMKVLEEGLKEEIRTVNDTTNQNMQAQFATQQKEIGKIKSSVDKLAKRV